ncbi:hypothetical protein ES703_90499 [subsurface metagenome]
MVMGLTVFGGGVVGAICLALFILIASVSPAGKDSISIKEPVMRNQTIERKIKTCFIIHSPNRTALFMSRLKPTPFSSSVNLNLFHGFYFNVVDLFKIISPAISPNVAYLCEKSSDLL